jgi:hypothetical protein
MKRKILLLFVGLLCLESYSAVAQFRKGDKLLNVGVGVNSYYNGGIPLGASLEVGITDEISVGAGFDFLSYNQIITGSKYRFTALYIGFRGSYHFNELLNLDVKELDVYGGGGLGFRNFAWRDSFRGTSLGNAYGNGLFLGIHIGARYYFAPNVGAFLEVGAGSSSNGRVGLALKF